MSVEKMDIVSEHLAAKTVERGEGWYRVDADYGGGFIFVGEASDRIGMLILRVFS